MLGHQRLERPASHPHARVWINPWWRLAYLAVGLPVLPLVWSWRPLHHPVAFGALMLLGAGGLLINQPTFIRFWHAKPVWFEDLEDERCISTDPNRYKYQRRWLVVQTVLMAITAAGIWVYYQDLLEHSQLHTWGNIGLVGGFYSLFSSIVQPLGDLTLKCLHRTRVLSPQQGPRTHSELDGIRIEAPPTLHI